MSMKPVFKKYSSIENHYQQEYIDKVLLVNDDSIEWVASEKVHGANFSFIVTPTKEVVAAKRTSIIKASDNFYASATKTVRNKYDTSAVKAFDLLANEILPKKYSTLVQLKQVSIYGELFGGAYSNPKQSHQKPIQCILQ
jgi:Rnl2 family RNA ligase